MTNICSDIAIPGHSENNPMMLFSPENVCMHTRPVTLSSGEEPCRLMHTCVLDNEALQRQTEFQEFFSVHNSPYFFLFSARTGGLDLNPVCLCCHCLRLRLEPPPRRGAGEMIMYCVVVWEMSCTTKTNRIPGVLQCPQFSLLLSVLNTKCLNLQSTDAVIILAQKTGAPTRKP